MSDYDKLDPELKARWLTALRSGEYKQTEAALQDEYGCNCCLGVLARIEGVPSKPKMWKEVEPVYMLDDEKYCGTFFIFGEGIENDGFPPDGWRGLSQDMMTLVADMNDKGKTFEEIADFIEENF